MTTALPVATSQTRTVQESRPLDGPLSHGPKIATRCLPSGLKRRAVSNPTFGRFQRDVIVRGEVPDPDRMIGGHYGQM